MKYHEAIDMIMDGGVAYQSDKELVYSFIFDSGIDCYFLQMSDFRWDQDWVEPIFTREDFTANDWIVEKDGVVYEEWLPCYKRNKEDVEDINRQRSKIGEKPAAFIEGSKDWFKTFSEDVSCPYCHSKDLIKADLKDIHSDFYTCTKCQWQGIFVQPHTIIADEVDEEWLEKKMVCFYERRHLKEIMWRDPMPKECNNKECQFCFPPEEPKEERADGVREKVTAEDIWFLFELRRSLVDQSNSPLISQKEREFAIFEVRRHDEKIKQKLEYLASLQEKD
jgi:hypothetical protein